MFEGIKKWWEQKRRERACSHGAVRYKGPAGEKGELKNYWHIEGCDDCGKTIQVMNGQCYCGGPGRSR